jgi:hypothetical protein
MMEVIGIEFFSIAQRSIKLCSLKQRRLLDLPRPRHTDTRLMVKTSSHHSYVAPHNDDSMATPIMQNETVCDVQFEN